jgi:hypothetical protein
MFGRLVVPEIHQVRDRQGRGEMRRSPAGGFTACRAQVRFTPTGHACPLWDFR